MVKQVVFKHHPYSVSHSKHKNNGGKNMQKIPKRAKQTADIPAADRNEWGHPSVKWAFAGYADETAWWVKA
jgi:hypothetical protein